MASRAALRRGRRAKMADAREAVTLFLCCDTDVGGCGAGFSVHVHDGALASVACEGVHCIACDRHGRLRVALQVSKSRLYRASRRWGQHSRRAHRLQGLERLQQQDARPLGPVDAPERDAGRARVAEPHDERA